MNKVSTTQAASFLGTVLTLYNLYLQSKGQNALTLNQDQLIAMGTAAAPVLSFLWIWKERLKKSTLKWGFLK